MRTIRISEEVWQAIASRGKFGETEDDVLRRVFEIPISTVIESGPMTKNHEVRDYRTASGRRRRFAEKRMTPYIADNMLHIEFEDGIRSNWTLPEPNNKAGVSLITQNAMSWAKSHGATLGQMNYIRKTLNDHGLHITK